MGVVTCRHTQDDQLHYKLWIFNVWKIENKKVLLKRWYAPHKIFIFSCIVYSLTLLPEADEKETHTNFNRNESRTSTNKKMLVLQSKSIIIINCLWTLTQA